MCADVPDMTGLRCVMCTDVPDMAGHSEAQFTNTPTPQRCHVRRRPSHGWAFLGSVYEHAYTMYSYCSIFFDVNSQLRSSSSIRCFYYFMTVVEKNSPRLKVCFTTGVYLLIQKKMASLNEM